MGKKKEKKQIDKVIQEYEEALEDYFMGMDFEDALDDEWDGELPFN